MIGMVVSTGLCLWAPVPALGQEILQAPARQPVASRAPDIAHIKGLSQKFVVSPSDAEVQREIVEAARSYQAGPLTILGLTFRESIGSMSEDKTYWLAKLKETNVISQALGDYLEDLADAAGGVCGGSAGDGPCSGPNPPPECDRSNDPSTVTLPDKSLGSLVAKNLQLLDRLQAESRKVDMSSLEADQVQLMERLERDAGRYRFRLERYQRLSKSLPRQVSPARNLDSDHAVADPAEHDPEARSIANDHPEITADNGAVPRAVVVEVRLFPRQPLGSRLDEGRRCRRLPGFEQAWADHSPDPATVEFELGDDGNAVALMFTNEQLASEGRLVRQGSLPEDWE